jgi:hypothetical protein
MTTKMLAVVAVVLVLVAFVVVGIAAMGYFAAQSAWVVVLVDEMVVVRKMCRLPIGAAVDTVAAAAAAAMMVEEVVEEVVVVISVVLVVVRVDLNPRF